MTGMRWVWSTHVKVHFVSSLALNCFGQKMMDVFSVLAVIEWDWRTQDEIRNVSSLSLDGFCSTQPEIHFVIH
jgi:hypothetical protein